MCFETTARPPLPPIAGGAGVAGSERLVLEASDGNRFNAFSARANAPDAPGIMILPDVRGLHPFYEELATRFAEAGVNATAMDYFGRTAGLDERDDDFDHWAHVKQITVDGMGADTAATLAHIRSGAGRRFARRLFGRVLHGWADLVQPGVEGSRTRGRDRVLRGSAGQRSRRRHGAGEARAALPLSGARTLRGADDGIPPEAIEGFKRALDDAGVPNEMVVYDGAPHSFFDRSFEEHRDACDDAWMRMLRFVGGSV